jgi:hypothetical protein
VSASIAGRLPDDHGARPRTDNLRCDMPTPRKLVAAAAVMLVYFAVLMAVWAFRPLDDTVPVGTDWTPTTAVPPEGQRLVSQAVECNTLFADTPRSKALPDLTPQPEGRAALAFQREPCELVHTNARRLLAMNVVGVGLVVVTLVLLAVRGRRIEAEAVRPRVAANGSPAS